MYYAQLNGLRWIFVFLVLLEHWFPVWVYNWLETGSLGVNLFFVLSGFLIGEILLLEKESTSNRQKSILNFFAKRTLRIFPLYYLVILAYGIAFTTGGILVWNLTYTNNVLECLNPLAIPKEFSHLWSLCVEEQFYLFFPFLVFFLSRRQIKWFIIASIAAAVSFRFCVDVFAVPNFKTLSLRLLPSCFDCLLGGAALAYLKCYETVALRRFFSNRRRTFALTALCIVLLLVLKTTAADLLKITFFRFTGAVLGFLLIGYSVMIGYRGFFQTFLENKFVAYLGKISYGIYLFHPFIQKIYFRYAPLDAMMRLARHVPKLEYNFYLVNFVCLALLTLLVSALSYELYEKRFLRLKTIFNPKVERRQTGMLSVLRPVHIAK